MRSATFSVLFSLALTACGGGEETTQAPPPPPDAPPAPPAEPAAPASNYQGMDVVADAGSIAGAVTYTGTKTDAAVKVTKDMEHCENTNGERPAGALLSTGGKLQNAVVYLQGVQKGKKMDAATYTVNNLGCKFEPHVGIAYVGATVAAKNSDPMLHNTNLKLSDGNKKIANIALPQKDQTVEKPGALKKAGLVDVSCDAHGWMQGYIFVADSPYAAVTDAEGKYSLTDVPAGEYTAKVWHEVLGTKEAHVTVAAGGAATLDFAFADEGGATADAAGAAPAAPAAPEAPKGPGGMKGGPKGGRK